MIQKILKKCIVIPLRMRGFSSYMAPIFLQRITEDLFKNGNVGIRKKFWAYKHGFLSDKLNIYGLNKSNYKSYLSDFAYYKMHPINGRYSIWIDDKLTFRMALEKYSEYLPKYFLEINKGAIYKLADFPKEYSPDLTGIIELLKKEGNLAVKLIAGTHGLGFYRISFFDDKIYINNEAVTQEELGQFIDSLENYIITEYIFAHKWLRSIYEATPNTLRIVLIHNQGEIPQIVCSEIRFGTEKSGQVDNISAGGFSCGIDIDNGMLFDPKAYDGNLLIEQPLHPDTGVRIEGNIPHWGMIKDKLIEISQYIPQIPYMGIDVIITDAGFKIIEINSHPDIENQCYYPLMDNEYSRRFFKNLMGKKRTSF